MGAVKHAIMLPTATRSCSPLASTPARIVKQLVQHRSFIYLACGLSTLTKRLFVARKLNCAIEIVIGHALIRVAAYGSVRVILMLLDMHGLLALPYDTTGILSGCLPGSGRFLFGWQKSAHPGVDTCPGD